MLCSRVIQEDDYALLAFQHRERAPSRSIAIIEFLLNHLLTWKFKLLRRREKERRRESGKKEIPQERRYSLQARDKGLFRK